MNLLEVTNIWWRPWRVFWGLPGCQRIDQGLSPWVAQCGTLRAMGCPSGDWRCMFTSRVGDTHPKSNHSDHRIVDHCACRIPMNISSIKWEGSRHAIFRFTYLQLQPFRGSLTTFYSDFKVVAEICRDLVRFLQCRHDPGCSYPQPLIIWSKMPRVGAQCFGSPALCHVKTCPGKMGKPFFCILSFRPQCRPMPTLAFQWAILE
jgi:hypothetical protein